MNTALEAALLDQVADLLRDHGLLVEVHAQKANARARADALLRIGKDRDYTDYAVEIKRHLAPTTLGAVLAQLQQAANDAARTPLLVTDYVTPPLAERLRMQKQQFVDGAGNAYLEGPNLFVYVTGRKPVKRQTASRPNRGFATAGLKILFALICDAELENAPYRLIAAAAGVALGTVPPVLADLQETGYTIVIKKRRRLFATKRLLDEWALVYARTLRTRMLTTTYVANGFATWRDWPLKAPEQRWGGEPAANLLVRYLKPGVLTIYAETLPPRLVIEQRLIRARPYDDAHLLELRKPFWGKTLRIEEPHTVPPALVYADLLATGDARCIETAQLVYERYLARFHPAA